MQMLHIRGAAMRLEWLEDILAVAETGSFQEAAERRRLTQSAFSRRVQHIEEQIGVDLFDRSRKPVQLLPTTAEQRDQIAKLANDLRQLVADLRRGARMASNRIAIASQHALTTSLTPLILKHIDARLHDTYVRLRSANLDECFALLLSRQVDIAIVYRLPGEDHPISDRFVETATIGSDRLVRVDFRLICATNIDLDAALREIAAGQLFSVDIASANGRAFVHQYAVGLYARLVRIREEMPYRNRWEKMFASLRSVGEAIRKRLRFQAEIRTARGVERRIASGIVVSNNLLAEGHLPHADDVDGGVLGVYVAKPMTWGDAAKLIGMLMLGRWKSHPRLSEKEVEEVTLTFPRIKKSAQAAIDGELIPLEPRVTLLTHPRGLKVFAPLALKDYIAQAKGPAAGEVRDGALVGQA